MHLWAFTHIYPYFTHFRSSEHPVQVLLSAQHEFRLIVQGGADAVYNLRWSARTLHIGKSPVQHLHVTKFKSSRSILTFCTCCKPSAHPKLHSSTLTPYNGQVCSSSTYCLLQVRAAVPMYLLSRKIKALGFKVVMSGEGADEIFGGYLYFHKAPSPAEFHRCRLFLDIRVPVQMLPMLKGQMQLGTCHCSLTAMLFLSESVLSIRTVFLGTNVIVIKTW